VRYTLSTHATVLGHTGAELTGLLENTRGWHFMPASDFESVRPVLLALQHATQGLQELMPTEETLATLREPERATFSRNAIMSDPRSARFLELMDEVDALALVLRDEENDGAPLPARTIGITELELSPEAFRQVLLAIDPASDQMLSAAPPFYLLVAGF
jgi:hypothetical protein